MFTIIAAVTAKTTAPSIIISCEGRVRVMRELSQAIKENRVESANVHLEIIN